MKKKLFGSFIMMLALLLTFSFASPFAHAAENEDAQPTVSTNESELAPIELNEIEYDVNKNLTEDQIQARFNEINSKYSVNEPFSPEDAEFVRAYAAPKTDSADTLNLNDYNLQPLTKDLKTDSIKFTLDGNASESFSKSKTAYSTTVKFTGTVYSNINILNHSYRGNLKAQITSGGSKVSKIKLTVTNVAYGVVGNSGTYIGIVYDGSASSSTTTQKTWSMDKTVKYSAVGVVYTYTNAYVTVTTSSGSYNLYAF